MIFNIFRQNFTKCIYLGLREYLYEITRGLYNNIINKIGKTKKEKELVIDCGKTSYNNIWGYRLDLLLPKWR